MIGSLFLREVPEALYAAYRAGDVSISGSMIRWVKTGRIAGHLQETSGFGTLARRIVGVPLSGGGIGSAAGALGSAVNAVQLEQVKAGVAALHTLGLAQLALGVGGIGVSVAGFAVVSARLARIDAKMDALGDRLAALSGEIAGMRRDVLGDLLAQLRATAEQVEEGWAMPDPEPQWRHAAITAHALANQLHDRAQRVLAVRADEPETVEPLLEALALAIAIRVAARLAAGEDAVAAEAAEGGVAALLSLGNQLRSAEIALARARTDAAAPGTPGWAEAFDRAVAALRPLFDGIRAREDMAASTAALLPELAARGVSGRAYLEAAREERQAPILFMPFDPPAPAPARR